MSDLTTEMVESVFDEFAVAGRNADDRVDGAHDVTRPHSREFFSLTPSSRSTSRLDETQMHKTARVTAHFRAHFACRLKI